MTLPRIIRVAQKAAKKNRGTVTPKNLRPRCGAKCQDGHPCQARAVWDRENDRPRNGRCRKHGGMSTGPKTEEGKRRCADGYRRWVARQKETRA